MSSSEEETTTSDDNLSYESEPRSRSPIRKDKSMEAYFIAQIEAKDQEIRELKAELREIKKALSDQSLLAAERHAELQRFMVRGAAPQPNEATESVADPTPQQTEMDTEPIAGNNSGLKRTAPRSEDEEPRTKGKRKATADEIKSFAQATAKPATTHEKAAEATGASANTAEMPANTEATKQKIPPIILHKRETWSAVAKQLQDKRINYTKARLTTHGIDVQPATVDDYRRMSKYFDDRKYEYHTYALPEERQLRVIIRGLPDGIQMDEIKEDLASQGITATTAERLTCRRTKRTMPLVLVKLPQDQEKVLEVTRCCSLVVRVERQKAQQQSTQCFRCQRFGHAQSKCTGEARCVKCGQNHRSNECGKAREQPAQCANCRGAHPANYRGCPSCPKQRGVQKGRTSPRQEPATRVPVAPAATGKQIPPPKVPSGGASTSFAEVTRRGKRVTPQATPVSSPRKAAVTMGDAEAALAKMTKMFAAMSQIMQQFSNIGA